MRRREDTRAFPLTAEGIDDCAEHLEEVLADLGLERKNLVRIRLSVEESMVRLRERFGERDRVVVTVNAGVVGSHIRLVHNGVPYNPLGSSGSEMDEFGSALFSAVGIRPQYTYAGNRNVMRFPLPHTGLNDTTSLLMGLGIGVIVGVVGGLVLSATSRQAIILAVFNPLFNTWIRALNALAAPVVFLMTITTMLDMRKVDERGGSWWQMTVLYFGISFAVAAVTVLVSHASLRLSVVHEEVGVQRFSDLLDGVTRFIPEHILEPFVTSNTPQLLFLAAVLANALIALDSQTSELQRVVRQCNVVASLVTKWVSGFVPFVSATFLALEIWNGRVELLLTLWKPLLLASALCSLCLAAGVVLTCIRYEIKPKELARKLWPAFRHTAQTGSLDASYGVAEYSCVHDLGIDKTFTDVALPQGLVLFMPASIMGTLAVTVFSAREYGVDATFTWYLTAIVLDVLLFVATPPVPGANLLAYIALYQVLGIPADAFLDAMIFDIVFGLLATAANQTLLQLEMMHQADRIGLIDRLQLRK